MVVIYSMDKTTIWNNLNDAKEAIIDVYGKKIGDEALARLKGQREGASFQKYGGPLIQIVAPNKAKIIRNKEKSIGMM